MSTVHCDLVENLKDKQYRDLFVAEQIFSGLPLKIRKIREAKFPSQKDFARKLGKHQSWVSQLENPNYGKLTLATLLEIASAFDVALEVDFVPFSRIIERVDNLSPEWFSVVSFNEDDFEEKSTSVDVSASTDEFAFYRPNPLPVITDASMRSGSITVSINYTQAALSSGVREFASEVTENYPQVVQPLVQPLIPTGHAIGT